MAHKIHTTEAIVVGSEPFAEANRWFLLFTPDLGLIRARAQGVRKAESKLKTQVLLFNCIAVSLVAGRDGWHLVGAESTQEILGVLKSPTKRELCAKLSRLLVRLIAGEEPNEQLYRGIKNSLVYLSETKFTETEIYQYELILVLRVLANLGYVSQQKAFERLADFEAGWDLFSANLPETAMLEAINNALRHSHL